jgi:hypothetical protein
MGQEPCHYQNRFPLYEGTDKENDKAILFDKIFHRIFIDPRCAYSSIRLAKGREPIIELGSIFYRSGKERKTLVPVPGMLSTFISPP